MLCHFTSKMDFPFIAHSSQFQGLSVTKSFQSLQNLHIFHTRKPKVTFPFRAAFFNFPTPEMKKKIKYGKLWSKSYGAQTQKWRWVSLYSSLPRPSGNIEYWKPSHLAAHFICHSKPFHYLCLDFRKRLIGGWWMIPNASTLYDKLNKIFFLWFFLPNFSIRIPIKGMHSTLYDAFDQCNTRSEPWIEVNCM